MLYHKDIFIPCTVRTIFGVLRLSYTRHAQLACVRDRYGVISRPPTTLDTDSGTTRAIEVETSAGRTTKVVYRISDYSEKFDLVLVVVVDEKTGTGVVKTAWLNEKGDAHSTLDRSKYAAW